MVMSATAGSDVNVTAWTVATVTTQVAGLYIPAPANETVTLYMPSSAAANEAVYEPSAAVSTVNVSTESSGFVISTDRG